MNTHIPLSQKHYNDLQVYLMKKPINKVCSCIENNTINPSDNQLALSWSKHFSKFFSKIFEPKESDK